MRLFVAVNLPDALRREAHAAAAPLRAAELPIAWAPPESLHVTLKFLGNVDDGRAPAIGAALTAAVAGARPFDLGLGGFGAFPHPGKPRVVWCGVEAHPALELLANDVERGLAPLAFPSELRPFHPHVTLGRARKDAGARAFGKLKGLLAKVDFASVFPVESVDLMRSTPGPQGSVYDVQHRALLAGAHGVGGG